MRFVIGIDPGLSGGVAFLDVEKSALFALPVPVFEEKGSKTQFDIHSMVDLLSMPAESVITVVLEQVGARPGQGVTSMFRFGTGYGMWQGIIAARKFPLRFVTPQKWKSRYGLSAIKEESRRKATELFPLCADMWRLKKHDGVAEAALMAHWGALDSNYPIANITPLNEIPKRQILLG